ncbi:hypothetical protein DENSPDRAFT_826364 [Dentipellis sp. KUC8613]|nr:hypothetical protein DENSPDRAFT_826364 [Dentipellis sp. KUC8613]
MSPDLSASGSRSRQRSSTNAFAPFNWRRGRTELTLSGHGAQPSLHESHPVSLDALVATLTPPAVPSLANARALTSALNATPCTPSGIQATAMSPVLTSLCAPEAPPALQAAGFDMLVAFCSNGRGTPLATADRFSFLALLLASPTDLWVPEVWEPRFRALAAISKDGAQITGIEVPFLNLLKAWIEEAFAGLVGPEPIGSVEITERERAIKTLSEFLTAAVSRTDNVSRLGDSEIAALLKFFSGLIVRAMGVTARLPGSSHPSFEVGSPTGTSTRIPPAHRRHHSSTSLSIGSPPSMAPISTAKRPLDIAVTIYLDHLSAQLQFLSPVHLQNILPVLFRCLAAYSTPLPRLSLSASDQFDSTFPLERRIVEMLDPLLNGTYTSSCFIILKRHLLPQPPEDTDFHTSVQTSTGACRALRIYIRRALCSRLARAYIARMSADTYTPSGAPGNMDLEHELMERAWAKDEVTRGDLVKVGRILRRAAEAWISTAGGQDTSGGPREEVLLEVAGVLKDVLQEYDEQGDRDDVEEEETHIIGEILQSLTGTVRQLRNRHGTLCVLHLSQPNEAPTAFLRTLSSLLGRDHSATPSHPPLTTILLSIAEHVSDEDTAKSVGVMLDRGDFSPLTPDWLSNWEIILGNAALRSGTRPLTRIAVSEALQTVFAFVRDIPTHRQPLAELLFDKWKKQAAESVNFIGGDVIWDLLADELFLRVTEAQEQQTDNQPDPSAFVTHVIEFLTNLAASGGGEEAEVVTNSASNPSGSVPPTPMPTATGSPILSRGQSEAPLPQRDREPALPSVISLLSSFASGASVRSHSPQVPLDDVSASNVMLSSAPDAVVMSNPVGAVVTLLHLFCQIAFTPSALSEQNRDLAVRLFRILVTILTTAQSATARLTVLQFFFRLRADRDHRLYSVHQRYDRLGGIETLAAMIGRVDGASGPSSSVAQTEDAHHDAADIMKTRARAPERNGRRSSRGREPVPSRSASSRSRSRVPARVRSIAVPLPEIPISRPLWRIPEVLPFVVPDSDTPSDGLISYDPAGPANRMVVPISYFLEAVIDIISSESNWEILSYVLCHLPTLLANKHLFCGPRSRACISRLLSMLCNSISKDEFAAAVVVWPTGLKARDAQGLAYHTLSVLISYRKCFEPPLRHVLVEVLITGLSGQQSSIKCCLHALTLSAFELQDSMRRFLPSILTKLSQIMTNATIAVHIINFLAIVGSLRSLYSNFIEDNFKMVFGVALQYLRLHNRPEPSQDASWALSQHVRIMSYYIVYLWFLAVKLRDRPKHVKYITRQLLLANAGKDEVDEPAEVCFDWLARYAYGSADPRPTDSMLSDILKRENETASSAEAIPEKSWIVGNAIITIRALAKIGWVDVTARRASGLTRVLARIENVPLVGPGEVDPDTISLPSILTMDRDKPSDDDLLYQDILQTLYPTRVDDNAEDDQTPDPITGYVWQGTAPSQRRKEVAIDPSYFALQLSPFPDDFSRQRIKVPDTSTLPNLFRTLDRIPVIDTHKVGIMYVAPGQTHEDDILANVHGSPAYTRFLEGIGRLINLRGQVDVYAGGLDPDEDGEYAYAWWDDIGQILYHTATLMPQRPDDKHHTFKKRHIGNDFVRIVWNDSGLPYRFDTLSTQFQFVNIVIEPHSVGAISAFSNNVHENEYFRVTMQCAPGMTEFTPIGNFKLISAENLPLLIRQLSLLCDWFASVFQHTQNDTVQVDMPTNWRARLQTIKRFRAQVPPVPVSQPTEGILGQEVQRDFTSAF